MTEKTLWRVTYFDENWLKRVPFGRRAYETKPEAEKCKETLEKKHHCNHTKDRVTHMSEYKVEPVKSFIF